MRKLRLSIGFLALVAVTFLFSSPGAFGRDMKCEDAPECGQPSEPRYDEGVNRKTNPKEHWRGGYNKDEIFESASNFFNVDKKVIEEAEKFISDNHMSEDLPSKETTKLILLARYRADNLEEAGQLSREEDRKLMAESVNYMRERRKKQFVASELAAGRKTKGPDKEKGGWGDLTNEVGISPGKLWIISKTFYNCLNCWYTDEPTIKDLEKQGLPHEDAIKIYILAKFFSDRLISSGEFGRMQEAEALREAIKHFVYEHVKKEEPWEKMAAEVEMTSKDLNMIGSIIIDGEKRPFNMPDATVPGVEEPPSSIFR